MRLFKVCIALLSLMIISFNANCEAEETRKGVSGYKTMSRADVIAQNLWEKDNVTFLCIASQDPSRKEDDSPPESTLEIFRQIGDDEYEKEYEYETTDSFLGMYPFPYEDNHDLLTVWGGENGFHFYIFTLADGSIFQKEAIPEPIDIDNDGNDELLVHTECIFMSDKTSKITTYAETTHIFKRIGETFKLVTSVPRGKSQPSPERGRGITIYKAIDIGTKEAVKFGYDVESLCMEVFENITPWGKYFPGDEYFNNYDPSGYYGGINILLKDKEYWCVVYEPCKISHGGSISVFVDSNSGEIITVHIGV